MTVAALGSESIRKRRFFQPHLFVLLVALQALAMPRGAAALARPYASMSSSQLGSGAGQKAKVGTGPVYYWFRLGDLRLHDNPGLDRAVKLSQGPKTVGSSGAGGRPLVPIFCFDPRIFGNDATSRFGSIKCAPRRAKFVLESVEDLRRSIESRGGKLAVAHGKPEEIFKTVSVGDATVVYQDEVCSEERDVARAVQKMFASSQAVWGSTMYDIDDLPYEKDLANMPDTFTPFRNKVEKLCKIGRPIPAPKSFSSDSIPEAVQKFCSFMPTMKDLGYDDEQIKHASTDDPRGVLPFRGGETAALARVKDYIWTKDLLKVYFDTRNGMIGGDYSTKFAPWLAHGNLSPRFVASECKKYEAERVENKSTYWVVFELLWRDFFKFFSLKHGDTMFFPGGTVGSDKEWKHYEKNVQAWKEGRTGFPLVDANMRELAATGFMSNRGRQNVCSFLALELNQDWRYGADYFESILLDYDVHSNWGNWCSGAGMTGGRVNRFNIVKQSKDYDQHGEYVRHWLPELANVPKQFVHEPWKMTQFQQMEYKCQLGVDYPNPIAKPFYGSPNNNKNSRNNGGNNKGRGKQNDSNGGNNRNRGRGQRKDMKSLKTGKIQMD